jgi:hypothetical protein
MLSITAIDTTSYFAARKKKLLGKIYDSEKIPKCRRKICEMLRSTGYVLRSYLGGGFVTPNPSEQLTAVNVHNLGHRDEMR